MEFVRVTQEWMAAHGILPLPDMRKNTAGTEYLLHEDYFTQMGGVVYECIQASGPLVYDLKDVPSLARPVEEGE